MVNNYVLLLCIGALALSSSCQSGGEVSPLALYPSNPEGHSAKLQGSLKMDGGCLFILNDGGERWLAAFPSPGTSWDPEERSVQVNGKTLQVGAKSGFVGGEITSGPGAIKWVQAPRAECDSSKIWLVNALIEI